MFVRCFILFLSSRHPPPAHPITGDFNTNKSIPLAGPITLHEKKLDDKTLSVFAAFGHMVTPTGLEKTVNKLNGHYYVPQTSPIATFYSAAMAAKSQDVFSDAKGDLVGIPEADYEVHKQAAQTLFDDTFRMLKPNAVAVTIKSPAPALRLGAPTASPAVRSTFRNPLVGKDSSSTAKPVAQFAATLRINVATFLVTK